MGGESNQFPREMPAVFDIKPQAQFQLVFIRDMRDTIMNLQQSVTNSFSKRE
jgi:hypothetical protein